MHTPIYPNNTHEILGQDVYSSTESKLSVVSDEQQRKQGFMAPLSQFDLISLGGAEKVLGFTFSRRQCS